MLVIDLYAPTTHRDGGGLASILVEATSHPIMSELDCSLRRQTLRLLANFLITCSTCFY